MKFSTSFLIINYLDFLDLTYGNSKGILDFSLFQTITLLPLNLKFSFAHQSLLLAFETLQTLVAL